MKLRDSSLRTARCSWLPPTREFLVFQRSKSLDVGSRESALINYIDLKRQKARVTAEAMKEDFYCIEWKCTIIVTASPIIFCSE